MDNKQTLRSYIDTHLNAHTPPETIRQTLVNNGWEEALVDEVIAEAMQPSEPLPRSTPEPQATATSLQSQLTSIRDETHLEAYGIRDAVKDAIAAIKYNARTIMAVAIVSIVIALIVTVVTAVLGVTTAILTIVRSGRELPQILISFGVFYLVLIITSSFLTAFVQSVIGIAIHDGANRKKSFVKETLRQGLQKTVRVALANMLFYLILATPLVIAIVTSFVLFFAATNLWWLSILVIVVSLVATIPLVLRFTLIPVVALFEANVPVRALVRRTNVLMAGGMGFAAKAFFLSILILAIVSIIAPDGDEVEGTQFIILLISNILSLGISLFLYAVLVVFYRNRKAVKG
jgi:hypothetical protein